MVAHLQRGQVWWRERPEEPRRPVLVLTRDAVLPSLSRILVIPATTRIRGIPTEVFVDEGDGMPRPSVFNLDTIEVASKSYLVDYITRLTPLRMFEVCQALNNASGCSAVAMMPGGGGV